MCGSGSLWKKNREETFREEDSREGETIWARPWRWYWLPAMGSLQVRAVDGEAPTVALASVVVRQQIKRRRSSARDRGKGRRDAVI